MKRCLALLILLPSVVAGQTLVMGPTSVVKIKFFRRVGNNITMTDERGPLGSVQTDNLIILTPPVIRYAADVTGTVDINAAASTSSNSVAVSGSGPATRVLVFHPAGAPAGDNDPAISFSIDPQKSISYSDLVGSFGRTGLGSVDVYVQSGSAPAPTMVTRVFNDAGAAGTNGFAEDASNAVPSSNPGERVLTANSTALLITPVDPARTRYNIGVRTFFGGVPVSGNQTITINVTVGSAVIYGATTDNVTNDPSVQFAGTI